MQMKTLSLVILTLTTGTMAASTIAADNCTTSFYCYGNSAAATVSTATRPPPIPPPNPNYTRQRNQAQFAARNNQRATAARNVATLTTSPPAAQPQPRANTPTPATRPQTRPSPAPTVQPQVRNIPAIAARPQIRANPAPVARQPVSTAPAARPPQTNPAFRANARPALPVVNRPPANDRSGCNAAKQTLLKRAADIESQAVIASTHGDRQRSVSLFRDAGRMRNDARNIHCN